ncbi:vWA domain-containing protein [Actinoalloteichus hymeniacidonis]|uniref:von Willebrand factor type A n=1 Tax=Actinoalloteichus hymeniacidonis TaxID=340345 RepID=A0AAC9HPC2_9PSEU|nr:extracellular solute-binding protein [Actinoalloteichus hymeniacidonis]AOS62090.1 von Willebrand factor type A [Actinoalloteichus hymeniacidonis]MBB5909888.1 Ca-activated chloride channel family protein [Actinoalloteichus hymeniacidonis]
MRTPTIAVAALLCVATLASCTGADPDTPETTTLRVLAGSELADMESILRQAAAETGVTVEFEFTGTLEGAEILASDSVLNHAYDAIWFSSNRYLEAIPDTAGLLGEQVQIMSSPVLLALSTPVVERLGWVGEPVDWRRIGEAAGAGDFTYGMTDPSASNSGFSALVAVSSALADTGSAVDAEQVRRITPELTEFFRGQTVSAGSSRWLTGAFTSRASGEEPGDVVDGLINYESELLALADDPALPDPLTLLYPTDGVVTADYPLTLLADSDDEARAAHGRLSEYLRQPEVQRSIMETTRRRPVVPGVELSEEFGDTELLELPFPATDDSVDALLSAYFNEIRRPSRTVYVLDTSGSMAGERIEALRTALTDLTGGDRSTLGRYRGVRGREEVTLLPFTARPAPPQTFTVPESEPAAELARIAEAADGLTATGSTAIYDSLLAAYRLAGEADEADPDRFTSIVLMTDGDNAEGADLAAFQAEHADFPAAWRDIPVFTVPLGEGDREEMAEVADSTGGAMFDPGDGVDLASVFDEIRGYQ